MILSIRTRLNLPCQDKNVETQLKKVNYLDENFNNYSDLYRKGLEIISNLVSRFSISDVINYNGITTGSAMKYAMSYRSENLVILIENLLFKTIILKP